MASVIPQTRNDIEVHQQSILCGHFAAQPCGGEPYSRGERMIRTVIVKQMPTCQCQWNEQDTVRCAGYRKHLVVSVADSNQDVSQGRAMVSARPLYSFTCPFVFQALLYITFQNQNVKKKRDKTLVVIGLSGRRNSRAWLLDAGPGDQESAHFPGSSWVPGGVGCDSQPEDGPGDEICTLNASEEPGPWPFGGHSRIPVF